MYIYELFIYSYTNTFMYTNISGDTPNRGKRRKSWLFRKVRDQLKNSRKHLYIYIYINNPQKIVVQKQTYRNHTCKVVGRYNIYCVRLTEKKKNMYKNP